MFQLFAALLEPNSTGALPDHYQALLPPLLQLTTWEVRGNVPGYTRLLAAIIPRAASLIVAQNQVEPILGIFQYLVQGKKTEQNGFDILEAVVLSMPRYAVDFLLYTVMALAQAADNDTPGTCWSNTSRRFSKFC